MNASLKINSTKSEQVACIDAQNLRRLLKSVVSAGKLFHILATLVLKTLSGLVWLDQWFRRSVDAVDFVHGDQILALVFMLIVCYRIFRFTGACLLLGKRKSPWKIPQSDIPPPILNTVDLSPLNYVL